MARKETQGERKRRCRLKKIEEEEEAARRGDEGTLNILSNEVKGTAKKEQGEL